MLIYRAMGSIQERVVSPTWLTQIVAMKEYDWLYIGRNIVYVIGRDATTAAKASIFSLESLGTCSSFHVEKPVRRCLTRVILRHSGILGFIFCVYLPYHQLGITSNYKLVGRYCSC